MTPTATDRACDEIPAHVLKRALEWQVAMWSGEISAQGRASFARWLAADAQHARAWCDVQRVDGLFAGVPRRVGARVLRTAGARRNLLRGIAWLGAGALLAGAVRETPLWQAAAADHATRTGERRQIQLADGTRVMLNTASAIDVRFDHRQRLVVLRHGEIHVATAPDGSLPKRAFRVQTRHGMLEALGTRFVVRDEPRHAELAVLDGAVEIRPRDAQLQRRIDAGEQAAFDAGAIGPTRTFDSLAAAWTRGMLVAERERLADFLARLARYRVGVVRCDPAVADLRLSGVYPLDDIDRVFAALGRALPVRVTHTTPYWVSVGPQS
jgi:transmembrane sensor